MFKRKKKKANERDEQFSSHQSPLSYPIGQAAKELRMSKRTLLRRAESMNLDFEWDGRGRRVRADDLQRLSSGGVVDNKKSNAFKEAESGDLAFDEEDDGAAYVLELPIEMRVWQRAPSGNGTVLKGDLFCDETYGCVHQLIKQTYGPGEYTIRPIENGVLFKRSYKVQIPGEPWILNQKRIRMENKNKKEAFKGASDNSQARKDERISQWLDPTCLRWWWVAAKLRLCNQKCSLTIEDFISGRRSFKLCLEEMEEDEIKLITGIDAYELFYSHLQRLCPQREQGEDDDSSFSDAQEETQRIEDMLQEIVEEIKRFEDEQSEKNTLLLFLCALCLILLFVLILAQQPQLKPTA